MERPLIHQVPAAMEPRRVKAGRQGEAVVRGLGTRRIKAELPGIVPRAEEASILTGQVSGPSTSRVGKATPLGMPSRRRRHQSSTAA